MLRALSKLARLCGGKASFWWPMFTCNSFIVLRYLNIQRLIHICGVYLLLWLWQLPRMSFETAHGLRHLHLTHLLVTSTTIKPISATTIVNKLSRIGSNIRAGRNSTGFSSPALNDTIHELLQGVLIHLIIQQFFHLGFGIKIIFTTTIFFIT